MGTRKPARPKRPRSGRYWLVTIIRAYERDGYRLTSQEHARLVRAVPNLARESPNLPGEVFGPSWLVRYLDDISYRSVAERLLKRAARRPELLSLVRTALELDGNFRHVVETTLRLRRRTDDADV